MAFDFKKEYKEFYLLPKKPGIVTVPPMNYIAVRGKGNPNDENGEYKTKRLIIKSVLVEVNHDNIRYDKSVV